MRPRSVIGVVLCLISTPLWAQSTAQIHGTIRDSSGSVVPGAEVKATQTATGAVRVTTSSTDGGYVLAALPVGRYQLEITREGFTRALESDIELQVNADPSIDVALKVGAVSEQVNVEANAALVETRSNAIGGVIENQRILELPLNGRNVTDFVNLAGAAVTFGTSQARWFNNLPNISIGGQLFYTTDYSLDGANHLSFLAGTTMPIAFPDAVQEFKTESSGQTAQRGAASSVSVVTKSGTNQFHGDLFEFLRNDAFGTAHDFFSTTADSLKRNQFGGTIGGPIRKNKLFFFGGFQETELRQRASNSTTNIPTAAMLAGDWTAYAACQGKTLKAPFADNKIDPALYSPQAMYIWNKILPTVGVTPDACGRVTYGGTTNLANGLPLFENDQQYTTKVDYQITDKNSAFFRLLNTQIFIPAVVPRVTKNLLDANGNGSDQFAQSYAVGDTYVMSSTIVQSFRAAFNRTANTLSSTNLFTLCDAGVNVWCTGSTPGQLATIGITGGPTLGTGLGDGDVWNGYSVGLNDDITWIRGAHQMSFGGGFSQGRVDELNHFAPPGNFQFTGSSTNSVGIGLADFFLGIAPTSFFQGLPNTYKTRQNSVSLYFTDSWKISSHLTFNFGVRWEPYLPLQVTNGQISNFDLTRFQQGVQSTVFVKAPVGFYFPGDPGFPEQSGANRQWWHFDPRGGVAWDPKGDGKLSIRAAYSFGYAYIPGINREDQGGSNPWGGRATFSNPASFADPFANVPGGNPYPYTVDKNATFIPRGQFITSPYDLPALNTYSWNVAIQRQIGATLIASASYIGSRVMHMYANVAINPGQVLSTCVTTATGTNPCSSTTDARRSLSILNPAQGQFVGAMDQWDPSVTQRYNALVLSAQKRLSHGVSAGTNWTWSHCTGYMQGFNSKQDQTVTAPGNPLFDRGDCDSDRRHIVSFTAVAQTPRFANSLVRMVGTGWQLAGIYNFKTGIPISVQVGTDRELTGINHQRPNLVDPAHVYGSDGPGRQFINPAAFAPQPFGTFGNLGWNSVVGPTYWGLDLALSRRFRVTERQAIELRADGFNITNSFVANPPSTATSSSAAPQATPAFATLNSPLFGQILNSFPARKIQFALKYTF
jgi:Carboxypeptidase regulatory-like domain